MELETDIKHQSNNNSQYSHQQSVFTLLKFNKSKSQQTKWYNHYQLIGPQMPLFKGKRFNEMPGFMQRGYLKKKTIYFRQGFPPSHNKFPTQVNNQAYQISRSICSRVRYNTREESKLIKVSRGKIFKVESPRACIFELQLQKYHQNQKNKKNNQSRMR